MKKITLIILAAALIGAASCEKKEPTPLLPENTPQEITFKANIYTFTKATDTAFENSDAIGVSIFNPEVYLFNKEYTFNDGKFSSSVAHKWYEDQELESTITAVYPFNGSVAEYTTSVTFNVKADQSAKAGYAASDLMVAKTTAKPTPEAVQLPFKHALSKIQIQVDNQLGEGVANVFLTDVHNEVTYDPKDPANLTTTESKSTVKAYKSGEDTWTLIVAPQTEVSPKLTIVTVSGKQYSFELTEKVTFSSGKISTAEVILKEESIYTSFTSSIEDWVTDNVLDFSETEEEVEIPETESNVIYLQPNENWKGANARFAIYSWITETENAWTDMTDLNSDGIYKVVVPEGHTSLIFCRMNPETTENNWDNKWNQSDDIVLPVEGNCFEMLDGAWGKDCDNPWAGLWKNIEANE